jgi:hypothetical protein
MTSCFFPLLNSILSVYPGCSVLFSSNWCVGAIGWNEWETYFTAHGTPFFFELLFFFFFPHLFISLYFVFELSRSYFSLELGTRFAVLRSFSFLLLFPFSFHTPDFAMLQAWPGLT